jgi:hypothetical protein
MSSINSSKQKPSLFIWFLIFILLILLLIAGLRFAPVYVEHRYVVSALHSLQNDPSVRLQQQTNDLSVIQDVVLKRLIESGVVSVNKNNIQAFYLQNGDILIRIIYTKRIPIVGNISITLPFHDSITIKKFN